MGAFGISEPAAQSVLAQINTGGAPPEWSEALRVYRAAAETGSQPFPDQIITISPAPSPEPFPDAVTNPIYVPSPADDPQEDAPVTTLPPFDVDFPDDRLPGFPERRVISVADAQRAMIGAGFAIGARLLPLVAALARAGGSRALSIATNWRLMLGAEAIDLVTPGIDLPSPSDALQGLGQQGPALSVLRTIIEVPASILTGITGFPGNLLGGLGGVRPPEGSGIVVKSWTSNGIPFFKMADGWTWVRKLDGSWKKFRQPKPIVLMPGGAGNLRTLLRATGTISRQLKKVDKALTGKLGPRRRRARAAPTSTTYRVLPSAVTNISND